MEQPKAKKRQLDVAHLQSTPYFKMRAIVKELRPHIIQVLRTPDFRNCKAATEIRQELNVLMDLCKEMAAQRATAPTQSKNGAEGLKPSSVTNQNMKSAEKPPAPSERPASLMKPCDDKGVTSSGSLSLKPRTVDAIANGTYIVGGSAFGWNFIVYPGDAMVYYGRTKESFRSSNPKSQ
ncbi:unnamed protein product [Cuscuta epithymum]|uniref:Uncharacterized protein n=1 Tax=Cuscuta epithymum TaxID=186058 RepID=A0AAV0GLL3_9ASTE|nr:unnamed protein product [Cuscuta epithymum]CAH9148868.1 unnamed protein product [Cuscuta epithymum]